MAGTDRPAASGTLPAEPGNGHAGDQVASLDLATGLAILGEGAAAVGRAAQLAASQPLRARAGTLIEGVIAFLRDRLGYDVVWGLIGDDPSAPGAVRAHRGPAFSEWPPDDLLRPALPVLATIPFAPVIDRSPGGLRLTDPPTGLVDERLAPLAGPLGLRAVLAVPLLSRQLRRVVGIVIAGAQSAALGTPAMLQLLELIGSQFGTAIGYLEATERLRTSEERARVLTEEATDGIYMVDEAGIFTYVNPHVERELGYSAAELIGHHFGEFAEPPDQAQVWDVPRHADPGAATHERFDLALRRKDGEVRTFEISARDLFEQEGRFTGRLGIMRDITARRQLEAELARRTRALEALNTIATLAGRSSDLGLILREALDRTLAVFEVDRGAIHLLDEERGDLALAVQRGYGPAFAASIARLPKEARITARTLATDIPVTGRNMAADATAVDPAVAAAEQVRAYACVALRSQERVLGLLSVTWRDEREVSSADRDTLVVVGAQLGAAIENARLATEAAANRAGLEAKTGQLSRLLAVSAGFAANRPLEEVLDSVARAIAETLGFGSAHVRVRTERGDALIGAGFHGYEPAQAEALRTPTGIVFYDRLLNPRFQIGGVQYIPHSIARREILGDDWTVVRRSAPPDWQPGQWHPEDALVVPLRARDGALLGVIYVDEPLDGRVPGPEALALLELFGRQAALAIENVELYAQTQRDLRHQNALREVIEHISAELDLDRLLEAILANAVDLLGGDAGAFGLIDQETGIARIGTINNMPDEVLHAVIHTGQGLSGTIMATGQPLLIDDYAQLTDTPEGQPFHSCLGVPVYQGSNLVGTFFVGSTAPERRFGPRDVETLELFAKHAALALGNAHLYEEARAQTARLETLREAIEQISSELDLPALLNRLAVSAVRLLDADFGTIALVDEESGTARIEAGYNLPPGALGRRLGPGEGLTGLALAQRAPLLLGPEDPQPSAPEPYANPGHAHLAVPLWWQDRLIGTFTLSSGQPGKRFTAADLDTLALLARHAAVAIENAGLYSALQERFSQVEGISAVGTALVEERNLERVLRTVAEQIIALLGADSCAIALLPPDESTWVSGQELEVAVGVGVPVGRPPSGRLPLHSSITGQAILRGEPVLAEGLQAETRRDVELLRRAGVDTLLCVPLQTSERTVGAINAFGGVGKRFGPRDIEIVTLFAHQAAVAIENARLYEQARVLAVAEERNRMAREIHDTLAQGFTGIILQLEVAQSLLEGEEPAARERMLRAQELARTSLREARRSVWNLRPSSLQGRTLPEALRAHLTEWRGQTGIATDLGVAGGARPLAPETEDTLLRVAQEALNNIYKHARARRVELLLTFSPEAVQLRVDDDGSGFAGAGNPADGGGFGLVSMRERANRLGGTLTIESTPGEGTRVEVTIADQGPPARRDPGSVP